MEKESEKSLANATARGIANEKTRESIAVYKVIGAVLLAWMVGAAAGSVPAGVVVMLLLFVPIWRTYTGNPITNKWYRRAVVGFWAALGGLVMLSVGLTWWGASNAPPPEPPSPAEIRHDQVQALVNRAEAQLVEHIKSQMHDPSSFEIASEKVTDRGGYIILNMHFRGRNPLGATVLSQGVIAVSMEGKVLSLELRQ